MCEEKCGLRRLLRSCSAASRRSLSSLLSSNPHAADESEILASSVEWLSSRVDELLFDPSKCAPPASNAVALQQRCKSLLRPLSTRSHQRSGGGPLASVTNQRRGRQQCHKLLHKLLKRLQVATRTPSTAALLISDEAVCYLLPLAICSGFFDMPPACELLLARTLSNLSCHPPSCELFSSNNLLCNLIDSWLSSPCLLLSLCGLKIAANMSTFTLLATLDPGGARRPYCIYQPDVYELARPFFAAPLMDIIFVNGMLGSVFYTWKQGGDEASEGCSECWPRDWLAEDLPRARVLALNLKIAGWKWRGCCAPLQDAAGCLPRRANEALDQLLAAGVGNRLTAFVCHSFGGLIIKQVLQVLHATSAEDPVRRQLLDSVHGLVFVAVPHLGRSKAINVNRCYWRPVRRMCLSQEASNVFDGSCHVLSRLHAWFVQFAQTRPNLRVLNLIELDKTRLVPWAFGLKVCPESWVDKLVGDVVRIPLDHITICKPPSREHESYIVMRDFLGGLSHRASAWRTALFKNGLMGRDWHRPERNCEEELRLRYGVSSARCLWTSSEWHKLSAKNRPRFYDIL